MPGGPTQPEITTLPFPDVEANSLEALMLPNLTQSVRYYICSFVAMLPLCIRHIMYMSLCYLICSSIRLALLEQSMKQFVCGG